MKVYFAGDHAGFELKEKMDNYICPYCNERVDVSNTMKGVVDPKSNRYRAIIERHEEVCKELLHKNIIIDKGLLEKLGENKNG